MVVKRPDLMCSTALLLVLSAGGAWAGDPLDPAQGRFSDEWAEVYMSGAKVGYSHATMAREADHIHTEVSVMMELARGAQSIKLQTFESTTEEIGGAPLSFESLLDMSVMQAATRGKIGDGKVTIVQSQFGMDQTQVFPFPEGALMTWGAYRENLIRGFESGTEYTTKVYAPQLRLDDAVTARTVIGDVETYEHRGKKLSGRRATVTMKTPATEIEMVSWLDEDGRPLKAVVPAPGIGDLEIVATDQAKALADFIPPEFFVTTFVQANRGFDPKTARRVKYRIKATSDAISLGELPTLDTQKVSTDGARAIEVVVARQPHVADGKVAAKDDPAFRKEYLGSNLMINIEDEELIKLARRAGGGESEPFALADKLRRFVTDYVTDKNLTVAFATASEVCRTREGDCSEHGVLLAALGRLNGLPSRVVVGLAYLPEFGYQRDILGYHMWTQFYIDGRWIDFDAALRESECSPTRIAFAVSSLKNAGLADLSLPLLGKLGGITVDVVEVSKTGEPQ